MVHIVIDTQPMQFVQNGKIIGELPTKHCIIENWSSSREGYGKLIEELHRKYGVEYVIVCFNAPDQEETQKRYAETLAELLTTKKDASAILSSLPDIEMQSRKFESNEIINMQEKIDELHREFWVTDIYIRLRTMDDFEIPEWR